MRIKVTWNSRTNIHTQLGDYQHSWVSSWGRYHHQPQVQRAYQPPWRPPRGVEPARELHTRALTRSRLAQPRSRWIGLPSWTEECAAGIVGHKTIPRLERLRKLTLLVDGKIYGVEEERRRKRKRAKEETLRPRVHSDRVFFLLFYFLMGRIQDS